MNDKQYNQLKKSYAQYKKYLLEKVDIYQLNKQIITEGIVGPHSSVEMLDRTYKKVQAFVDEYETYVELVRQLEDVGVGLTVRSVN